MLQVYEDVLVCDGVRLCVLALERIAQVESDGACAGSRCVHDVHVVDLQVVRVVAAGVKSGRDHDQVYEWR